VVAVKLASSVEVAAWQTAVPIFTAMGSMLSGMEPVTAIKVVGVSVSVGGSLFMVFYERATGACPIPIHRSPGHSCSRTVRPSNCVSGPPLPT
jgi:hypothetical protein